MNLGKSKLNEIMNDALFDCQTGTVKLSGEHALISKIGADGVASIAEYTKQNDEHDELLSSICTWCELLLNT